MQEKAQRPHRSARAHALWASLLLFTGIAVGFVADRFVPARHEAGAIATELGTPVRPGPWGELYTVPFTIAAPDELLPIRSIESGATHWFFKNFVPSQLARLLDSAELPAAQRDALLAPAIAHESVAGIDLTPTPDMVVALPARARQAIYRQLAQFPENRSSFYFIHKSTLADRFTDSLVSRETLALFHTLSSEHGAYLVFGGLPALLAKLPDWGEKLRFMKALTRQKTILVRLRVTKDSDINALAGYWGKGCWAPNIRAILESIERVPGGTFTSLLALLPPIPSGEAYFYPVVQNNPLNGPGVIRDCHWTSLNFFRDTQDPESSNPEYFTRELAANYCPIAGDPRYGDVLVMTKPDGEIVHSAVVIADEIVFTKNGATAIYPWMFATVPDLLKQYSFLAPDGQQLTLRYFRSKGV